MYNHDPLVQLETFKILGTFLIWVNVFEWPACKCTNLFHTIFPLLFFFLIFLSKMFLAWSTQKALVQRLQPASRPYLRRRWSPSQPFIIVSSSNAPKRLATTETQELLVRTIRYFRAQVIYFRSERTQALPLLHIASSRTGSPWTRGGEGGVGYTQKSWAWVCGLLPNCLNLWPRSANLVIIFMTWPKIWYSICDLCGWYSYPQHK